MDYAEYRGHDGVGLARLIVAGEVSAGEVLEAAISRAEEVNGELNAIVRPMYDIARRRAAGHLGGALAGVPFLVKDLHQEYAGVRTGSGSRATRGHVAGAHSELVRRWLAAGVVVFGRTNTPEFGLKGVTEPEANGPTRNPWSSRHSPGGSSGGSAAAVAAGVVPFAGAGDGGGSIRIPASHCGIFGLKPGRGVVPVGPDAAERMHGAVTEGVVSRSVRDTAAMLDAATAEPYLGGPYLGSHPVAAYRELAGREPGKLRIGFTTHSPLGFEVCLDAVQAVWEAARLLSDLGHDVEQARPDIDDRQMSRDFLATWYSQMAVTMDNLVANGAKPGDFELDTRMLAAAGREVKATVYIGSMNRWNAYNLALAEFHSRYDLLLTPTVAQPPTEIGELDMPTPLRVASALAVRLGAAGKLMRLPVADGFVLRNLAKVPYTQLANITGRPAMSVPAYVTPEGLPLGVQFVGGLGSEGVLLSLATQIEGARPWDARLLAI